MSMKFGVADTPVCSECKSRMRLTRRGPHPVRGHAFELQNFTCRVCHHEIQRTADRQGEVLT
jgi:transposase-like protein